MQLSCCHDYAGHCPHLFQVRRSACQRGFVQDIGTDPIPIRPPVRLTPGKREHTAKRRIARSPASQCATEAARGPYDNRDIATHVSTPPIGQQDATTEGVASDKWITGYVVKLLRVALCVDGPATQVRNGPG